jgi:hypothetical protein
VSVETGFAGLEAKFAEWKRLLTLAAHDGKTEGDSAPVEA